MTRVAHLEDVLGLATTGSRHAEDAPNAKGVGEPTWLTHPLGGRPRSDAHEGPQRFGAVGTLPGEFLQLTPEVTVGGGLGVDRT